MGLFCSDCRSTPARFCCVTTALGGMCEAAGGPERDETKESVFSATGNKRWEGDWPSTSRHSSWGFLNSFASGVLQQSIVVGTPQGASESRSERIPATYWASRRVRRGWVMGKHRRPVQTGASRRALRQVPEGGHRGPRGRPPGPANPGIRPGWVCDCPAPGGSGRPRGARPAAGSLRGRAGRAGDGPAGSAAAGAGSARGAAGAAAERRGGARRAPRLSRVPE